MQRFRSFILTFLLLTFCGSFASADISRGGDRVDLSQYTTPGKATIFDFYSDFCGLCQTMGEMLDIVDQNDDSLVVKRVNIDRSTSDGIDWGSPVAEQYGIESVPYLVIYDGDELFLQGDEARDFLIDYLEYLSDDN